MASAKEHRDFEAVEMKAAWEYDVNKTSEYFRRDFPQEFIDAQGMTKLSKGEQGWRLGTSEDGMWSMCQFPRGPSKLPTFKVPTSYLLVGVKANLQTIRPTLQATSIPDMRGATALHRFIRAFWSVARNQRSTLASLGLWNDRLLRLFDDATFDQNLKALLNALTPEAARVLANPSSATLERDMIRGLKPVTKGAKGPKMCYLRIYSEQPDSSQPGVRKGPGLYVGTTDKPGQRLETHDRDTESADLHHYRIARNSPPEARHMFVLMNLDGFDEDLTAMAEETFLAVFGTYASWHFLESDGHDQKWLRESQRAKTMAAIAQNARLSSGFALIGAETRAQGCNVQSPLFHTVSAGRAWLRQSLPPTPYQPAMERYSSPFVFPSHWTNEKGDRKTAQLWFSTKLNFKFNKDCIEGGNLQPGMICNLVIEITRDKVPHPKPYVKLPEIGLYENNGMVLSVAIFVESFQHVNSSQPESGQWFRTQIFHQRPLNAIKKKVYVPEPYFQVMRIIQLLEGIVWEQTDEYFKDRGLSVRSMEHLKMDHLNQTLEFVNIPFPQKQTRPLPKRMSLDDNAALFFEKHPNLAIGPSQRPTQQERNVAGFAGQATIRKNVPEKTCDGLWWNNHFQPKSKMQTCTGSNPRACNNCIMYFNRPCTFSPRELLVEMQAQGDPLHLFITKPEAPFIHQRIIEPVGGKRLIEEYAAQMNELNEGTAQTDDDDD
ncbi:hypothetical protein LQW54_010503 [Pestalotiopsis sp. IQ-011]